METKKSDRFSNDAGLAVGPILFVIVVLGILGLAIAAGNGTLSSEETTDDDNAKAFAVIQIGQNLKIGMDRITGKGKVNAGDVVIGSLNTKNENELFSPTGGGVPVPSVAMAANPTGDVWYYPRARIDGLGDDENSFDRLAVLKISRNVCKEVNNKVFGDTTISTLAADLSVVKNGSISSVWPRSLAGKLTGCVQSGKGYYFYQVIAIQ